MYNMCMERKLRKDITIDKHTYEKAKKKSKSLGLSFSGYISFLINSDNGEK